jgi:lipopolysaccharide transport system ATP-binding protein
VHVTTVIRVANLSKKYLIGARANEHHRTLRDSMTDGLGNAVRRLLHPFRSLSGRPLIGLSTTEDFWALRDLSFDIEQGDRVGIIGPNGAGKTTLLKILSRITEPTEGAVFLKGRVASLLEVGTGFHPELTGRENIFLNGAILGMAKPEIKARFDEIVDFAEVEKFLDTPVKRYSSGMYVRLAFAVAAHLEPEILIVDEVLAVGDVRFQRKCLGKMKEAGKEGRTVLFVSHNMGAIKTLCERAIYLEAGTLKCFSDATSTINEYLNFGSDDAAPRVEFPENKRKPIQIKSVSVVNLDDRLLNAHPYDSPFKIHIELKVHSRVNGVYFALHILDSDFQTLLFSRNFEDDAERISWEPGLYIYDIEVPSPLFVPGIYRLTIHVANILPAEIVDGADNVCPFELVDTGSLNAKKGFPWRGRLSVPLKWALVDKDNKETS